MSDDITKVNSHIKWLWTVLASACLFYAGLTAKVYISQQGKNEAFAERLAARDLQMQKEIAQIQVDVAMIRVQVTEINRNIKELSK
jgi:hypothetical protein